MKAAIQKRLGQTAQEYEMMVVNIYHKWCAEKTSTIRDHQKAMTSPALFNWFYAQINKYERQFISETETYKDNIDSRTARMYYAETILPVFKSYSRPLMQNIIKKNESY